MHAEDAKRNRDQPILEGRFFEVSHAIEARCDPVTGLEHVAGDLRLHGVHIVHERWRAENGTEKNERCHQQDDELTALADGDFGFL